MYLIAGTTGNTGTIVAQRLLSRGQKVRVLVRGQAKGEPWIHRGAEVAVGRLEDERELKKALEGVEGAYLLVPPDLQAKDFMGRGQLFLKSYQNALANSDVKHVAFLSSIAAQHPTGTGPIKILHQAEKSLASLANIRFSFVRAAYFMENLLAFVQPAREQGMIPVFGGGENYPFPMVATRDIGEVAGEALLEPPSSSQVIELSGPAEYSFADAAQVYGQIFGRPVRPQPMPIDALVPTMMKFGMSQSVAAEFREMTEAMGKGLMAFEGGDCRAVRGKVTLETFLKTAVQH